MTHPRTLVLGAGNFGTALAQHLAQKGVEVTLWARDHKIADNINNNHHNPRYLTDCELSSSLVATSDLSNALARNCEIIVLAIPTQYLRGVLEKIASSVTKDQIMVCAAKGIELDTLKMPISIVKEACSAISANNIAVLSGPSFAIEVVKGQPTAVSSGSIYLPTAQKVQQVFHTERFRVYSSDDPIGLEVSGALKNVIALAAGAAAGLGLQNNAQAALLTRGLAEITRIGVAMGAQPITFNGLGGVGDLFLTCTSSKSRNYRVGFQMGEGRKLADIVASLGSVAEGIATAKAAYKLSKKLKIDAPITSVVYKVIYEKLPVDKAVSTLLGRDMKPEVTYP